MEILLNELLVNPFGHLFEVPNKMMIIMKIKFVKLVKSFRTERKFIHTYPLGTIAELMLCICGP